MSAHTYQFLVTITTERELQEQDVAAALTGTGNACADPRHDQVSVFLTSPAPVSHLTGYRCAACGERHAFGESCLESAG